MKFLLTIESGYYIRMIELRNPAFLDETETGDLVFLVPGKSLYGIVFLVCCVSGKINSEFGFTEFSGNGEFILVERDGRDGKVFCTGGCGGD